MLAHYLKKTWNIILCNSFCIYLLGCNTNQVRMHIQESNTFGKRTQSHQMAAAKPKFTGDEFDAVPDTICDTELYIREGLLYIKEVVRMHPIFQEDLPQEVLKRLGLLKQNTKQALEWSISNENKYSGLKLLKADETNPNSPVKLTILFIDKSIQMLDSSKKVNQSASRSQDNAFQSWKAGYIAAMKALNATIQPNLDHHAIDCQTINHSNNGQSLDERSAETPESPKKRPKKNPSKTPETTAKPTEKSSSQESKEVQPYNFDFDFD